MDHSDSIKQSHIKADHEVPEPDLDGAAFAEFNSNNCYT
jgi:hypothetical protein